MKAVRVYDYGGNKQLVHEDLPKLHPRDEEILVRVYGA